MFESFVVSLLFIIASVNVGILIYLAKIIKMCK